MISKIKLSPDLKITSRENTTWTQGDETNNIYLYVPDETIQLVELFVTKPGGMVNIDTVKFIKGIDEEGNSIWLAPNGIPSKLFQFTIYTGLTAQATFSFKLHSGINILDIKYKTTVNTIWTINKSDASITENDETNETQQWRAIGSLSNDIVLQRNDFNDHLDHNVPDEVTEEDPDVHGVREALDRLTVEVTQAANDYTDQEIEVLDGDLTFYMDTLDQNMDNKKVDKIVGESTYDKAYIKDTAGNQTNVDISTSTDPNTLIKRDASGRAKVANPIADTDAANKIWTEQTLQNHNVSLDSHANQFAYKADLVNGLVPAHQLPSYVDDVVEVQNYSNLPRPGESGKIYVVKTDELTGNDHSTYRWGSSDYVLIHDQLSKAEIKTLYESNANTNAFTDAEKTKLAEFLSANNYYDKTYIDSLASIYGWVTNDLGTYANGGTFNMSVINDYDYVLATWHNTGTTPEEHFTVYFKVSDLEDGVSFRTQVQNNPYRAGSLHNVSGMVTASVADASNVADTSSGFSVSLAGIKMSPIDAKDVTYESVTSESTTVKAALDELYSPQYETSVYDDLTSEITATDTFNIKDESGELVKIEGNGPVNLVTNGDLSNGTTGWSAANGNLSMLNNLLITTGNGTNASTITFSTSPRVAGTKYYSHSKLRVNNTVVDFINIFTGGKIKPIYNPVINQVYIESDIQTADDNYTSALAYSVNYGNAALSNGNSLELFHSYLFNISQMILNGVKDDAGIPFANLTDEEIKEQMDIWVENGWPTKIEKIISKSDNLFDAKFKPLTNLDSEAIIVDGTIPSGLTTNDLYYTESDEYKTVSNHYYAAGKNLAMPDLTGKEYLGDGEYELGTSRGINIKYNVYSGIYTLNGVAVGGGDFRLFSIDSSINISTLSVYYVDGDYNGTDPDLFGFRDRSWVGTRWIKKQTNAVFKYDSYNDYIGLLIFPGNNTGFTYSNYQFKLQIEEGSVATTYEPYVTPKKIVNLTDLIADDILPVGLDNNTYLNMITNQGLDNVPLRESNPIAVEPNGTYKIIKASSIPSKHKVVEYTPTNELVKVTDITYTNGKSQVLTMDSTTSKIKIVSDLLDRVPQIIRNSNFMDGQSEWSAHHSEDIKVVNNVIQWTNSTNMWCGISQGPLSFKRSKYYGVYKIHSNISGKNTQMYTKPTDFIEIADDYLEIGWNYVSGVADLDTVDNHLTIAVDAAVDETFMLEYVKLYDVGEMINKGVRNDDGILFSRLINDEIQTQMDTWVKEGFPDHVIRALYPNGADTAISFKYNDADDVFRALETDEMRINLQLRSGEYWENGYVVKQNGNADYFPLDNTISAWNYGQLEAVYSSGLPANFHIKYPLNTIAQTESTSNYLQEARKQLDYVTNGYNDLVDQLGALIDEDGYNSFVGITSEKFDYYNLDGVTAGDTLKIVGTGQSVQNLLPSSAVASNFTQDGLTISYDLGTGIFTVNGTFTGSTAKNFTLAENIDFNLPSGTEMQLMRYYVDGTIDLQDSYVGYLLQGSAVNHRINENSESLYDPYINAAGSLSTDSSTYGQRILFQVWKPGMVFNNFQFKIGIYEGLKLQPYVIPGSEPAKTNVTIYNRNENALNLPNSFDIGTKASDVYISYDNLSQEFLVTGTVSSTRDISLTATFPAKVGERFSIKRVYQAGDVKDAGGVLPVIKLVDSSNNSVVENTIYEKIPDTEETTLPTDITFNTGSAPDGDTLTLKLEVTAGQQFQNYRFRLMIHDNATDIGYVPFERHTIGTMIVGKDETAELEFDAIGYGILEFVAQSETLNLLFGSTLGDLSKSTLEYNSGIASPTRKITELDERTTLIDEPYKDKVIAIWGDSRESNNPTSDPSGVGDQLDTSWPALLAKKTGATVLNYGLSGGCWTENTVQQDAASAIVNRISTQDVSASADVIIISVMNDFKLASPLGSPLSTNKDKTTFYGAMRVTYEALAAKYPGKKIYLVLPQKRYDEDANYGGGSYYHYLKAQVEVANEYGIPVVDLYNNMPGVKNTAFYSTYMLNDTHWNAAGNDRVAELVMRALLGNGNKGNIDIIPPIPTTDGAYTLQVTITSGVPTFTWVLNT